MKRLFAGLAAACCASAALATGFVSLTPLPVTSASTAVAIATAGTFQSVLAANANRLGCTVQNTSADTEYVYFGANAAATTGASVKLTPGAAVSCTANAMVLTDNLSMTSAAVNGATAVVIAQ